MKINITLKLDSEILREARRIAADERISISEFIAVELQKIVRQHSGYPKARRHALARLRKGFALNWERPAAREEIHERSAQFAP